jgi:capsid assembly protease
MDQNRGWRLMAGHTWALSEDVMQQLAEQLSVEMAARSAAVSTREIRGTTERNVGIVQIIGTMLYRPGFLAGLLGAASVKDIIQAIRTLRLDQSVSSIVVVVDSGGGVVTGIPELAAEIRATAAVKPLVAQIDGLACSAAYWGISGATEIVITPSGVTGSIGCFRIHVEESRLLDKLGITPTIVRAGRFKIEDNELEPLKKEARSAIQRDVDEIYGRFVTDVAKGRKTSAVEVRTKFGEGRVVMPAEALRVGMVDRIDTLMSTLERVARNARSGSGMMASSGEDAELLRLQARQRERALQMDADIGGDTEGALDDLRLRARARARSMELTR